MQIDAALIFPGLTVICAVIAAFWRAETRANILERRIDAEALYNAKNYATRDGIISAVNSFTEAVNGLRSDVQGNISGLRLDMREDRKALADRLDRIESRVFTGRNEP